MFPYLTPNLNALQPDARTKELRRCRKVIESTIQELLVNRRQNIAAEKAAGAEAGKDLSILNLLRES